MHQPPMMSPAEGGTEAAGHAGVGPHSRLTLRIGVVVIARRRSAGGVFQAHVVAQLMGEGDLARPGHADAVVLATCDPYNTALARSSLGHGTVVVGVGGGGVRDGLVAESMFVATRPKNDVAAPWKGRNTSL